MALEAITLVCFRRSRRVLVDAVEMVPRILDVVAHDQGSQRGDRLTTRRVGDMSLLLAD